MRRINLTLIIRVLFFIGLIAVLAVTAVRGEAGQRAVETGYSLDAAVSESVATVPFRLSPEGAVQKWVNSEWVTLDGVPSRATALAAVDQRTVYVGTEALGAFETTDGGDTWVALNNAALGMMPGSVLTVTALEVDMADARHIVAATAYLFGTSQVHAAPGAIYESRDGGATWQVLADRPLTNVVTELELNAAGTLSATSNE
jgi:photosystem II stability/assembly factor-like uncharacterized protein